MRKEIKIEKVKNKIKKLKIRKQEMELLRYDIKVNTYRIFTGRLGKREYF